MKSFPVFSLQIIVLFLFIFISASSVGSEKYSNIVKHIDYSNWLNGADASITFTWDDTNPGHYIIADVMEVYGFYTSFFVYPGRHPWCYQCIYDCYLPLAARGHEIGNHSMNHPPLVGLELDELIFEVNEPINIIYDATGFYPVSFVHPYNQADALVDSVVFRIHLFSCVSSPYGLSNRHIRNNLYSSTSIETMSQWIDLAVNENKWLIIGGHGIDGRGWQPITSELTSNRVD